MKIQIKELGITVLAITALIFIVIPLSGLHAVYSELRYGKLK